MNSTANIYQRVQVETTTDSIKLIVMLYEGAINFLEQAKLRAGDNQMGEKGILINKVIAIVSELQCSLNISEGGDVAQSLDRLYTYMINRLLEANANSDIPTIDEVLTHLRTLKSAWSKASEQRVAATAQPARSFPAAGTAMPPSNESAGRESEQSIIELVG